MMSGFRLSFFGLLCALALAAAVPAVEEGGAEVVPLPEDTPVEKQAPPKPPQPVEPARAQTVTRPSEKNGETPAETVPLEESPREPSKELVKDAKEQPKEPAKPAEATKPPDHALPPPAEAVAIPPEEVRVTITDPAAVTAPIEGPPKSPPKEAVKELVKEQPKEPAKPAEAAKPPEPPKPTRVETAVIQPERKDQSVTEAPAETVPLKEPPKEPPKEPVKELVKEQPKEPAKPAEAAKPPVPPKPTRVETAVIQPERKDQSITEAPAETVPLKKPARESPKEPPKELAQSPEPAAIRPPEKGNETVAEPAAEAVPLPAVKPTTSPDNAAIAKSAVPGSAGDLETLALTADNPVVLAGQAAVFNLYGPEAFLRAATGRYMLRDEFGRCLAQGTVKVSALPFSEGKPRQLKVEIRNPVAQQHTFELALTAQDGKSVPLHCDVLVPRVRAWDNWVALVAAPPAGGATGWATLGNLGIRGGMQYRLSSTRREALRKGNVPFYVENVGRQLLSRYHTERGLWEKTIAAISANPSSRAPLMREPSLCSQAFAEDFAKELQLHAEAYAKDQPLFYSLASEPSVTRLAAAADFDFSPESLQEFQRWLERDVYGTLKALNSSWDTQFADWAEVVPMTTVEARLRLKDGVMNFGPWVDFRGFQDYMFSKVLRDSAEYLRRYDPKAKAGITGALGPFAFGGWDWSRLAQALDVVEAYDIGGARALWRDLAPGKPALAALSLSGEDAQTAASDAGRTVWSLVLEGGPRGVTIWDEEPLTPVPPPAAGRGTGGGPPARGEGNVKRALLDGEGKPTPLAQALAPLFRSLDGEIGALLANSVRLHDGVAILYSPASVRLHWLFEAQHLHGDKWLAAWGADTGAERRESPQLRLRESWGKLLDDLGLSWRFVSSAQLENKELLKPEAGIRTLVLPQTIALSDREAAALKQFVANGGQLVADAACGRFDEHGCLREKPALDDIFQINTSTEPFVAQPLSPLERVQPEHGPATAPLPHSPSPPREGVGGGGALPPFLSAQNLRNLAPVFSDQPKWLGPHQPALEYRRSPVLAVVGHASGLSDRPEAGPTNGSQAVYLNLDLTDYLRWRLHPDQPRAQAVREVVGGVAFAPHLGEGLVDREHTRLPAGTQFAWLQVRGAAHARLLALRRNPQTRLHELGSETDTNAPFEKPEPFSLVLRQPAGVEPLVIGSTAVPARDGGSTAVPARDGGSTGVPAREAKRLEGTLDPVTPALFLITPAAPTPPDVMVSGPARAGEDFEINVTGGADAKVCLFSLRLFAPDNAERACLAATRYVTDGTLRHTVPLAFNEPAGTWKLTVRDLANGGAATVNVEVSAAAEDNKGRGN